MEQEVKIMSQLRQNKLTGEWIIYAENRQKRPYDFVRHIAPKDIDASACPFCPGREDKITEIIEQVGTNEKWSLRVFSNLYPAVSEAVAKIQPQETIYQQAEGVGRHEILVDTPEHGQTIDTFSKEQLTDVFNMLFRRYESMATEKKIKHIQIFKNCGADAGMSISHSHWQILGLPLVSKRILDWKKNIEMFQEKTTDCMFCDMITYELKKETRMIGISRYFLAFVPYASRFPYEVWIAPKRHFDCFCEVEAEELLDLSEFMLSILRKIVKIKENVGYNICFMDAPLQRENYLFHWHIEIMPRIGGFAGLECATETYINSMLPERAAHFYRNMP